MQTYRFFFIPTREALGILIGTAFSPIGEEAWGLRVANCESGFNILAKNASGASGLFQFKPETFYANAKRAGITKPWIWNYKQQIITAVYMIKNQQHQQWECQ